MNTKIIYSPACIQQDNWKMLKSLAKVLQHAIQAPDLNEVFVFVDSQAALARA